MNHTTTPVEGTCLCGAVTLSGNAEPHVGVCHCSMCRKWGGGPYFAVDCGTDLKITGEDHVATFSSSEWAERGFCKDCGTHLFYRLKGNQQYMLPAGLLSNQDDFKLDHQIFIDKKPAYYDFANETETMTEAEVFAKYAP
ncbi:MAG: GFA family protein [Pseudomonadales bacterium]|uniref:Glutathione-dependent formaldehyde-activating GFA n=1 Tax=Oleiphilus messinensis TaxID=141451 RepID=A0A1Y0I8M9_9GAMM|nr:GFA family protein [Oleiphilus messinensis]ARU56811.1 glutathione-dependent formaldehyde-activating GFA [Oleiphilus messinensis]MCG8613494.1 GFA family protein [Pseudomonadales bacterium]